MSNIEIPSGLVTIKETDFLDQDPPIRGQKYACISFISPEDVIANKDVFILHKFMKGIADDVKMCLDNMLLVLAEKTAAAETVRLVRERHSYLWSPEDMQSEFYAYRGVREHDLDDEFRKVHGVFTTSIRGFKIRGVYDSVDEAKHRAKAVRKFDDKFHVYIAEMGCWCPWSPNPDNIADFEYSETQLNTLMSNYQKCQDNKEDIYNDRKKELIKQMNTDNHKNKLESDNIIEEEDNAIV